MTPAAAPGHVPHIGFGHVWHTRLRPRQHRFSVPTFFLMLPMRMLRAPPRAAGVLALNRAGVLASVAHAFAEHDVSIQTVRQEGRGDDAQDQARRPQPEQHGRAGKGGGFIFHGDH